MTMTRLLGQFQDQQQHVLNHCLNTKPDYRTQYHPELSPAGWHLGHCIFTENYWTREVLLGLGSCDERMKFLYIPTHSPKASRSKTLPEYDALYNWAKTSQQENRALLQNALNKKTKEKLLRNGYLIKFLIQHYAQHYETLQLIATQAALGKTYNFSVKNPINGSIQHRTTCHVPNGEYQIGATENFAPYDNEYPRHTVVSGEIHITENPVCNSDYLSFMEAGGYTTKSFWSDEGWQWCKKNNVQHPEYWRKDKYDNWYEITITGASNLKPGEPIFGISHYEASAFANWSRARLPYEYEWEIADQEKLLKNTGKVWEWCQNTFQPYAGFEAFPYTGYSTPYFDGRHFVLKGASFHTQNIIRRTSFRNYYPADKRHMFAGMRLVFE